MVDSSTAEKGKSALSDKNSGAFANSTDIADNEDNAKESSSEKCVRRIISSPEMLSSTSGTKRPKGKWIF